MSTCLSGIQRAVSAQTSKTARTVDGDSTPDQMQRHADGILLFKDYVTASLWAAERPARESCHLLHRRLFCVKVVSLQVWDDSKLAWVCEKEMRDELRQRFKSTRRASDNREPVLLLKDFSVSYTSCIHRIKTLRRYCCWFQILIWVHGYRCMIYFSIRTAHAASCEEKEGGNAFLSWIPQRKKKRPQAKGCWRSVNVAIATVLLYSIYYEKSPTPIASWMSIITVVQSGDTLVWQ